MLNNRKHIGLNKGFNSTFGVITSGIPPSNTVAPSISGTNQVGFVLTAVNGTYIGTAPITITGVWQRNGVNISPVQSNLTYTQKAADIGTSITWHETGTNAYGSDTADSNSIATTGIPPSNTVAPVVSGTLEVGQTLTSTTGTWTGTATITYAYQWKRGVTNIGTDSATYVAVYADISENITCTVTATNAYGSASQVSNTVVTLLTLQAVFNNHAGRNQWAAENSTVVGTTTTCIDYAATPLNVLNPAAGNQPTTNNPDTDFNNKKSLSFDGVDDFLINNTANYGAGQTTGSMWFVIKTPAVFATHVPFSVSDLAANISQINIFWLASGKLSFYVANSSTTVQVEVNTALAANSKYIIAVESNGSTISIYINNVLQAVTVIGVNLGQWFSHANVGNTLDNITIGSRQNTIKFYYREKIALVGNYPLLTAGNRADMFNKLNSYYSVY